MNYENSAPIDFQDAPSSNGRLYSISEMARLLNVSTNWFYERTRKGTIPFHKFGKHIRFTEADLTAIVTMFSCGLRSEKDANSDGQTTHA